jgi:tetratricopeptide (TPR) repeat protein
LSEQTGPLPRAASAASAQGAALLREDRFAEAIGFLSAAVLRDPADARIQLQLGIALQAIGRHAEALRALAGAQRGLAGEAAPYLHAAVSHLALGDHQAALIAGSDACHRDPKLATAHYVYGQAWLALGRPAEAEQAFAGALLLEPGWADAFVNLGLARYRQGAVEDGKIAMRHALRCDPENAAAIANLCAFMRITGESEAAEVMLRERLDAAPEAIGVRLNMAAELLQEGEAADALALLGDAFFPADPAAARHFRLQQASALLRLGRPEEARAALEALAALGPIPPDIAPLLHWRRVVLALADEDRDLALAEAGLMEAALERMGPQGVPEHAIMARFELARFWSQRDDWPRAFGHWTSGHRQLSAFQPFSREAHRAFVDVSIARFDKARLHDGPRASNSDPAPVFIVGMPRSGTTLIEQILASHRDVHGAGERPDLARTFSRLSGRARAAAGVERIAAMASEDFDRAADEYLAGLHALAPAAVRIVDKMPSNFLQLGLASLMLPGARIIHCARDPRDIGYSIFTLRFHGHHDYAHDLADLGWYIGEHDRLMAHFKAALPTPILTVKLADWIEDFDATLARVLAHLDLPPDENCARFYELDRRVRTASRNQVREPINDRGLGRWRAHAEALAPLIAELEAAGSLEPWGG